MPSQGYAFFSYDYHRFLKFSKRDKTKRGMENGSEQFAQTDVSFLFLKVSFNFNQ